LATLLPCALLKPDPRGSPASSTRYAMGRARELAVFWGIHEARGRSAWGVGGSGSGRYSEQSWGWWGAITRGRS
jgi:hypothetical protein